MKLVNQVTAEGNIEEWLDKLLKEMQNTVNRIISYAAADCQSMDTESLTHKYQAQVSLIGPTSSASSSRRCSHRGGRWPRRRASASSTRTR